MVKPYRIKHKASGLYYQHYNGSNLGKDGKVYFDWHSPLTIHPKNGPILVRICRSTLEYNRLKNMLAKYVVGEDGECVKHIWGSASYLIPVSEFEKEEL